MDPKNSTSIERLLSAADRYYRGGGGRAYHDGKRGLPPGALPWVMKLRAEKFQPFVRSEDVVFELGVGSGWNLGHLVCSRKIGCDPAEFLAERLSALGIEFFSDVAKVPSQVADVAICHQTLEHIASPAEALAQLARLLRPSGRLVLHVPWERERRYAQYRSDEPNHHLYNWNSQNLGNLLEVLGFEVQTISVCKYGYDRFAAQLALRLRVGEPGYRFLRRSLIAIRPLLEVRAIARVPGQQSST
jgi:SAM-dependent methyltransferase